MTAINDSLVEMMSTTSTPDSLMNFLSQITFSTIVYTLIYGSLAIAGTVGNMLVVAVVISTPNMRTPTNCYLVSLAISDTLFLVTASPSELFELYTSDYKFGAIGCSCITFLTYLNWSASTLSVVAFTIERFIGVCHPMRARYMCTVRRATIIILSFWVAAILYNSVWLYLATTVPSPSRPTEYGCSFRLDRDSHVYKALYVFDFVALFILPISLNLFLYINIVIVLRASHVMQCNSTRFIERNADRSKSYISLNNPSNGKKLSTDKTSNANSSDGAQLEKRNSKDVINLKSTHFATGNDMKVRVHKMDTFPGRHRRSSTKQAPSSPTSTTGNQLCVNNGQLLTPSRPSSSSKQNRNQSQVVKMLAVVTLVFTVCNFPYRSLVIYNSFATQSWSPQWFVIFVKILIYINSAINPILYNMMSTKFRGAFIRFLTRTNSLHRNTEETVLDSMLGRHGKQRSQSTCVVLQNGTTSSSTQLSRVRLSVDSCRGRRSSHVNLCEF